jgi:hypothetical protein
MNRVAPPVATASEVLLPARAATTSLLVPTILDEVKPLQLSTNTVCRKIHTQMSTLLIFTYTQSLGSVVGKIACGSSEEWDDDLEVCGCKFQKFSALFVCAAF